MRQPTVDTDRSEVIAALPDVLGHDDLVLSRYHRDTEVTELYFALPELVWEHIPGGRPVDVAALERRMTSRVELPDPAATWIVRLDGRVVGTTSHFPEFTDASAVEIGATFMAPQTWGTGLNARVKRLMIRAAWDAGSSWIRFRTDERNIRSATAIRRLDAVDDGELLEDIIRPDGTQRTSLLFRLDRLDG